MLLTEGLISGSPNFRVRLTSSLSVLAARLLVVLHLESKSLAARPGRRPFRHRLDHTIPLLLVLYRYEFVHLLWGSRVQKI